MILTPAQIKLAQSRKPVDVSEIKKAFPTQLTRKAWAEMLRVVWGTQQEHPLSSPWKWGWYRGGNDSPNVSSQCAPRERKPSGALDVILILRDGQYQVHPFIGCLANMHFGALYTDTPSEEYSAETERQELLETLRRHLELAQANYEQPPTPPEVKRLWEQVASTHSPADLEAARAASFKASAGWSPRNQAASAHAERLMLACEELLSELESSQARLLSLEFVIMLKTCFEAGKEAVKLRSALNLETTRTLVRGTKFFPGKRGLETETLGELVGKFLKDYSRAPTPIELIEAGGYETRKASRDKMEVLLPSEGEKDEYWLSFPAFSKRVHRILQKVHGSTPGRGRPRKPKL